MNPPKVTTLYGIKVPEGKPQICRYDDGTGDELPVPLGTTAFVDGKTMFDILPAELKSVAVRARVRYAPHPYVWMARKQCDVYIFSLLLTFYLYLAAHALPTGLGIESEGLELPDDELPAWEESRLKTFPIVSTLT